ncbi:hypothetical protein [Erysipelothrix anatis]|uniref:hypothetical protein n=1 Tax=Erysipelothrix anatis TaxID=2683713 RepID=UPI00135B6851|nr:hypothetical protein [Erysipelothrix anatis]
MPSIIDLLQFLGLPTIIIQILSAVFVIYLVVKTTTICVKNHICLKVTVVDDIALVYRSPFHKSHPHALFKLKIRNLTNKPIAISSIFFETKGSLFNKSTPLNDPRSVYIGIPTNEYGMIKKKSGRREILVSDQFENKLYLEPKDVSTKYVYFYNFLKIQKGDYATIVFEVGTRNIKRKFMLSEGVSPNSFFNG